MDVVSREIQRRKTWFMTLDLNDTEGKGIDCIAGESVNGETETLLCRYNTKSQLRRIYNHES